MVRRFVRGGGTALAVAMLLLAVVGPTAARVDGGCPRGQGWEASQAAVGGEVQLEAWLAAYPTNALALEDGIYTAEELEGQILARDRNGNGWLCVKDVNAFTGGQGQGWTYWVNAVDDNPAPKYTGGKGRLSPLCLSAPPWLRR